MSLHPIGRVASTPPTAAGVIDVDDPELDELRFAILARIRHTLARLDGVSCHLDRHGPEVVVHLAGPSISEMRRHAVAVRVLDAVRSVGHTYGHVEVDYVTSSGDAPA